MQDSDRDSESKKQSEREIERKKESHVHSLFFRVRYPSI